MEVEQDKKSAVAKYVYSFGGGKADGRAAMKNLLGGKGANLAEMTNLGIPVPPGFTITTEACTAYCENDKQLPPGLWDEVEGKLKQVEDLMGAKFGSAETPLLVSVRSGARISMPGMMDTVLNLGLNNRTVEGLAKAAGGNNRFAYDCYRRFIQMYGNVVLGINSSEFERLLEEKKRKLGVELDTELPDQVLWELIGEYKQKVKKKTGRDFPDEPKEQLKQAVGAVFDSWDNKRAIEYRRIHKIPGHWGTAVNIQTMVFGNLGNDSGTGVAFTRNPATGEKIFFGEYLINAQGEDVVAGIRTPHPINIAQKRGSDLPSMEEEMPDVYRRLEDIYKKLEQHYTDMQDIEFTIQKGRLYMLQTRTGKRTAAAAIKIAVDMLKEGLIDKKTAVLRVEPEQLDQLLHPMIDPKAKLEVFAKGLPASPGAAVGQVVFTAEAAVTEAELGKAVILVRSETSPEDIAGMNAAKGILTSTGGMTSHAAVVARGMGKPCVAGCGAIVVHEEEKRFTVEGLDIKEREWITLDGTTGRVIKGRTKLVEPELSGEFGTFMSWADGFRQLRVRTNADTPHDAEVARKFGAEGIGLCRTEHMFFGKERLSIVREMILADTKEVRIAALDKLLPMQRNDFKGILEVMAGKPVTIRLLDPPLHEFLPNREDLLHQIMDLKLKLRDVSSLSKIDELLVQIRQKEAVLDKVRSLHEFNPMLGHRGCRLGITYPEIYKMQVRAIFEAACELIKKGVSVIPEVMIPLVGHVKELQFTKKDAVEVAEEVIRRLRIKVKYSIGTMIEIPRAALTADEIAQEAEFFSFGTNDLTQMTFGFSRDDAGVFLPGYVEKGILEADPFVTIDQVGVGKLIKTAVRLGRGVRPGLKVGICGEHGGDPASVEFCHKVGLNYVSCSPYRVPIARLAAAHAKLKEQE